MVLTNSTIRKGISMRIHKDSEETRSLLYRYFTEVAMTVVPMTFWWNLLI